MSVDDWCLPYLVCPKNTLPEWEQRWRHYFPPRLPVVRLSGYPVNNSHMRYCQFNISKYFDAVLCESLVFVLICSTAYVIEEICELQIGNKEEYTSIQAVWKCHWKWKTASLNHKEQAKTRQPCLKKHRAPSHEYIKWILARTETSEQHTLSRPTCGRLMVTGHRLRPEEKPFPVR